MPLTSTGCGGIVPRFSTIQRACAGEARKSTSFSAALRAVRKGDFSVRLPRNRIGLAGELAEAFNDVVELNQRTAKELPHRERYLLLVVAFLRRLLELHLELVDQVERDFADLPRDDAAQHLGRTVEGVEALDREQGRAQEALLSPR